MLRVVSGLVAGLLCGGFIGAVLFAFAIVARESETAAPVGFVLAIALELTALALIVWRRARWLALGAAVGLPLGYLGLVLALLLSIGS